MTLETGQPSASQLIDAYRSGEVSPLEVVESSLRRIERLDPNIGAFREVLHERAIDEARYRTDQLVRGEWAGPLHGVPVAIKELFDVEGAPGCYGSTILGDRIAPSDAAAVARWREAGAIVVGTTRSHEFGWGITTQHAEFGSTLNPWDTDRVPGGSSGGSAAALAVGMVPLALGSDTGGSIRIPACFCGIAGIKPTYGRVAKRGAVSLAPSLDHPGPLARTVPDLAIGLAAMAGYDASDPSTLAVEPPSGSVTASLAGVRVGVVADLHLRPLRRDHQARFEAALEAMSGSGAQLVPLGFAGADEIRPTFAAIQMAEAHHTHSSVLGFFPERASEYGADVRGRLELAAGVTLAEYLSALESKRVLRHRFARLFDEVDVVVTPITAGGPSTTSEPDISFDGTGEGPFRDVVMDYTVPQDLFGLPVCAVPNGLDDDGLPLGVQLTGPALSENAVMNAAAGAAELLESPGFPPVAYGR
ncbi:MAG: amidase [bacterium]|nr:amidase [bacterium]MDE0288832.1 amidase [bacterium]MDE0438578.1 amidase [bacterium]